MTIGGVTTTLGALALGLATAAANPALAQNAPSTGTPPAAPAAKAPTSTTAPSSKQAAMPAHHGTTHVAAGTTHHPMHTTRMSAANPNAQNAAVDQLNGESLQAAQQGKTFTPSGKM